MRITKAGRKRKPRKSTLERDRIQILVTTGFKDRFQNECVPEGSSMNAVIRRLMQNELTRVRGVKKEMKKYRVWVMLAWFAVKPFDVVTANSEAEAKLQYIKGAPKDIVEKLTSFGFRLKVQQIK